jgi:two-component system phosphate regulon response regulator PhoB
MPTKHSILVVEDETDLLDLLRYNLEREGYEVRCADDGATALNELQRRPPDLLVLDRMLPGYSGDELIAQIRRNERTAALPVIMLTAKAEEADELVGFALGADDYVSKPFSMKVLLARVRALLRRAQEQETSSEVLSAGPVQLDATRYEVTVDGEPVSMTATEFRILQALMGSRGRVLRRSQLLDMVLGTGAAVTERTVDVHITALRKKLDSHAGWIQTVRGVGYTFRSPT